MPLFTIFFVQGSLRYKNNIFIFIVNVWCKDILEILFSETFRLWDHLNKKIAQNNIASWKITDAFVTLPKYSKILFLNFNMVLIVFQWWF